MSIRSAGLVGLLANPKGLKQLAGGKRSHRRTRGYNSDFSTPKGSKRRRCSGDVTVPLLLHSVDSHALYLP
jgi:hypothetical protein